jgi:hypothetical protein
MNCYICVRCGAGGANKIRPTQCHECGCDTMVLESDLLKHPNFCNNPTHDTLHPPITSFQNRIKQWMDACFIPELYGNMVERGDRFLEEVLELLQSHGYDKTRVATLVEYVYGRPIGEPAQEVGGVMVTLAGYCAIANIEMTVEAEREYDRICQPSVMRKIQAKQISKRDIHGPLPGGESFMGIKLVTNDAIPAGEIVADRVKAACTCECHKTVSLTRPMLWKHDHKQPIGRVEVINGKFEFHFTKDVCMSHEMLYEIFGNVGMRIAKQAMRGGLAVILAGEILEWSSP